MTDDDIDDAIDTLVRACNFEVRYQVTQALRAMVNSGGAVTPKPSHTDDVAVDRFAQAMKEKMAASREKGRSGWEDCSPVDLSRMLREHVEKGDPRDVANFCMMLWHLGTGIAAPKFITEDIPDYDPATQWGDPAFDGAEAYQAHLSKEKQP
ncbi:hypothetical protein A9R05_06710 [Burkholderia sp. KK1]|nr:hypothetical protein A9R05_06710 [Burkholderia sp. KK1]